MTTPGRDRIRELIDAVLADDHATLDSMASGAHASQFHFSRQLSRHAGESPVALRRRVMLERAAWQVQRGTSVTDAAFTAGYDSVEGFGRAFARAYGHAPSQMGSPTERGHWLPAPNGIHFHSPTVLYVDNGVAREESSGDVLALMIRHDLDDVSALLDAAKAIGDDALRTQRLPGSRTLEWDGPDESLAEVLTHLVMSKEPWIATIEGADMPDQSATLTVAGLIDRHRDLAPRWLAIVRDIDRRGAWGDRVIDALCEPPESFLMSQIVAHVLTFAAHRRQLARWMLQDAGVSTADPRLDPDPIQWHRDRSGGLL
ncbi:helix-turn-helix transcriptional regulator [Gordonia soli]|uniref:Putative AraC family transcriptional regulator n=1 Tax=Gordonia soli NBRC 108243 TaxID=1223545 RepID=M0QM45_9ACTN|nr:helix-turn-helix transcriptional regulator [Gordonia soli]GAC69653.1 putative AraC family transcriptional regulator [Gordonia soli NBRC 108243]